MTHIQKSALLSLLLIPGFMIHNPISWIFCFIGGFSAGRLVALLKLKKWKKNYWD